MVAPRAKNRESRMRHVLIRTFGCKLNQYDSQLISESFAANGYGITDDAALADVCVVNTCSVTARSDYQARQFIRKILRSQRRPRVVATGCYAQRAPSEVAAIEGVGLVTGNVEKASLPRLVEGLFSHGARLAEPNTVVAPPGQDTCRSGCGPSFQRRARALVKIQDGCDSSCTYCVVPSVRGRGRSVPQPRVLGEVCALVTSGYREIVLTGARVGSYGRDLGNGTSLESLVRALLAAGTGYRIRLSSLEPGEITESLLGLTVGDERVCRHFHVPLQSGDDTILSCMGRPYTASEYGDSVRRIKGLLPEACVGCDVMVGFPGESEEQFQRTYELLESTPVDYAHVFPYSRRPGTSAFSMSGQIPRTVKRARATALLQLAGRKRREFERSRSGALETVILEDELRPGFFTGTTGNYLRLLVEAGEARAGDALSVRIECDADGKMLGRVC